MGGDTATEIVSLDCESATSADSMKLLFEEAVPLETRRAVLRKLAQQAVNGDLRVAAFLFDRVYGRPSAAEPGEGASDNSGSDFDLDRLNDREFNTVVRLLEKCSSRRDMDAHPSRSSRGKIASTVSEESKGVRRRGLEGAMVGEAGRGRTRAVKV